MIFKGNIATLAKMDLTPTAFRIVLYLFSAIDYGNIIPDFHSLVLPESLD